MGDLEGVNAAPTRSAAGVVDTCSNLRGESDLVAQRLVRFAEVVDANAYRSTTADSEHSRYGKIDPMWRG